VGDPSPRRSTVPPQPGAILARLREAQVAPGSNVRGALASASWSYLLPSLELGRVVVVGRASAPTRATLERLSARLELDGDTAGPRREDRNVDLFVLGSGLSRVGTHEVIERAAAELGDDGRVYLETTARDLPELEAVAVQRGLIVEQRLAIRPGRGEMLSAVPLDARGIAADLARRGLAGPPLRLHDPRLRHRLPRRLAVVVDALARRTEAALDSPIARPVVRPDRLALILARAGAAHEGSVPGSLPVYVRELAGAGLGHADGAPGRWAFVARGDYNSQKPLFLVYPERSDIPDLVVKMTRDRAFADRLEGERDALIALEAFAPVAGQLPKFRFSGRHAGLAFLGETVLDGAPFERRARPGGPDPLFDQAVDFFIELGLQTRRPVAGTDLAEALEPLVRRFLEHWPIPTSGGMHLRADVELLARLGDLFTSFVHGDPGTWNLVAANDGRIGVLDWEAAEVSGPPLWDIARLVQAYSQLASPRIGRISLPRPSGSFLRVRHHLVEGSLLTPRLATAIERYRRALDIQPRAVEPLLRLAWVGRALKEADRLPAADRWRSQHARLVRLVTSGVDRPGWQALVGLGDPS
jgi:hypothetical protein